MTGWLIFIGYLIGWALSTRYLFHAFIRQDIYRVAKEYGNMGAELVDKNDNTALAFFLGAVWPLSLPIRAIYRKAVVQNATYSHDNMNKIIDEIRKNNL